MTQDDNRVSEGYLLLADISGYTAFLTGTELEHAQAIIRELTKLIRARLGPPMKFVKLEGDAVFCYADANVFKDGERFIELIEVCYFDFANRLQDMTRATTCKCDACKTYTRSYICHLLRGNELSGMKLATFHNLHYFNSLAAEMRKRIKNGDL